LIVRQMSKVYQWAQYPNCVQVNTLVSDLNGSFPRISDEVPFFRGAPSATFGMFRVTSREVTWTELRGNILSWAHPISARLCCSSGIRRVKVVFSDQAQKINCVLLSKSGILDRTDRNTESQVTAYHGGVG
jgi:hypothetical protein